MCSLSEFSGVFVVGTYCSVLFGDLCVVFIHTNFTFVSNIIMLWDLRADRIMQTPMRSSVDE